MNFSRIPQNPKILLYGYGLEGKSSERWAKGNLKPSEIDIFEDHQTEKPDWLRYDLIIKSPGVPPSCIPDEAWPKVTSNLRLFLENLPEENRAKVIGITGSKGKSTTAKFTHELLSAAGFKTQIMGNFGVPALEMWEEIQTLDFVVAECSSFQLYDLTVSPKYALFLSFFPDHLDWHNACEIDYFAAKENLWAHQNPGDCLLVPDTLPSKIGAALTAGAAATRTDPIKFTTAVSASLFPATSNLQALHFRENLGTVWGLAEVLGLKNLGALWLDAARRFEPIEHRLETVTKTKGLTFINDSIATSPDATQAGIVWQAENLRGLILDGADTGVGDFTEVVQTLLDKAPKALVALLDSPVATKFKSIPGSQNLNYKTFTSYESALHWLSTNTKSGVILFSPGGKSFNRFKNYQERGLFFKTLVDNI